MRRKIVPATKLIALLFSALIIIPVSALAQTSSDAAQVTPPTSAAAAGQHDFDSLAGTWKAHTKYRAHPFAPSDPWIDFDGTETFSKIWDGALLEVSAGANTNGPVGLMLYTYNPQSHQWSVYFASKKDGKVGLPNVGEFRNGQGEFFVQDTLNGKSMLNRYIWSQTASSSPHFEESWSADGGRTWQTVRIVDLARIGEGPTNAHPAGNSEP
ncbi:MAG TPA: hypothetical protein VF753_12335 [Terriglobales bacterium]